MLTSKSPFARFEPKLLEVVLAASIGLGAAGGTGAGVLAGAGRILPTCRCPRPKGTRWRSWAWQLLGDYLIPFEVISVLLLVVMIGAAYLARRGAGSGAGRTMGLVVTDEAGRSDVIGLFHYLVLAAVLFVCGLVTILLKRNALGILMGVELVLNAANINLVAFNRFSHGGGAGAPALDGQVFAVFVIVLAAAEAAVRWRFS